VPSITERFNQPEVASALSEIGIASPAALLATWITDRSGLENYASHARPVTDDQPRIEYARWVRPDELQRVLPALIELRNDPPLRGADKAFQKSVAVERQRLLVFYQAALNAQSGYSELWARDIQRVRDSDSDNAYYNWFDRGIK